MRVPRRMSVPAQTLVEWWQRGAACPATDQEVRMTQHRIVSRTEGKQDRHLFTPVTLLCSCGTKARGKSGAAAAFAAFDKHVKRAAAKEAKNA